MHHKPTACVYVDGFNLYYCRLKETRYKWLNLEALSKKLAPKFDIVKIRYFSAQVSARPNDPSQPVRQSAYWRALKTLHCLEIHEGQFLHKKAEKRRVVPCGTCKETKTLVDATEEKGSDVNFASHLLIDAFEQKYDAAIIITNDSDLCTPVKLVKEKYCREIFWICPESESVSFNMRKIIPHYRLIRDSDLERCLFPPELVDREGKISRPSSWR